MPLGNGRLENNYSPDDNKKQPSDCRFCGKKFISPMGRWRHIKKYHDKEFVRY